MSNRLDQEREKRLKPGRLATAIQEVTALGFDLVYQSDEEIHFFFKGSLVRFWAYSGWFTGRSVKDGRGLRNLLSQLRKAEARDK